MLLTDGHGRQFPYLRLSLTDVCNFRCSYCLPDGWRRQDAGDEMSTAEIRRLVGAFAALGTRKVRLTGGEPTVRRDFIDVVRVVSATPGIASLALTTNGWRLRENAAAWRAAGIDSINVSLDSLDAARFHRITGQDRHDAVLAGIEACLDAGYRRVKVNTVLMRGVNDDEFPAFLEYVRERPLALRFIELMETTDRRAFFREHHLSAASIRERLLAEGWVPCARAADAGPAQEFAHTDYAGRVGLIAPYGKEFCAGCNRLRVSSRGDMHLCLFGGGGHTLRDLLSDDSGAEALRERIRALLAGKQAAHRLHEGLAGSTRHLAAIGG